MSRAAIRYATALLDLAQEQGSVEVVLDDMQSITGTLNQSKDLRNALRSPVINADSKRSVLRAIFSNASKETISMIDILVDNKRAQLLGAVADEYVSLYNQHHNIKRATVTTAVPLTAELEGKVLAKVTELTGGSTIQLQNQIDEDIIGGFILRVGDTQYNASISSQLNRLKRELGAKA